MLWAHLLGTPRPPCQRKLTWIEKPSHHSWAQTLAYQAANCNLTNPGKTGKNCSINPKSHWEIISYFKQLGGLFQDSLLYNNSQPIQHSSGWWLIQRTTSTNFVVPKDPKESLGQKACTLGFLLRNREFWLFHQDVGFTWLFLCKWQWEHFLFPDSVSFIFILSLSSPLLWTQFLHQIWQTEDGAVEPTLFVGTIMGWIHGMMQYSEQILEHCSFFQTPTCLSLFGNFGISDCWEKDLGFGI